MLKCPNISSVWPKTTILSSSSTLKCWMRKECRPISSIRFTLRSSSQKMACRHGSRFQCHRKSTLLTTPYYHGGTIAPMKTSSGREIQAGWMSPKAQSSCTATLSIYLHSLTIIIPTDTTRNWISFWEWSEGLFSWSFCSFGSPAAMSIEPYKRWKMLRNCFWQKISS